VDSEHLECPRCGKAFIRDMREKSYRLAVRRGAENRPLPNDVFDSVLMSVMAMLRHLPDPKE
jgi:hypothetical protein